MTRYHGDHGMAGTIGLLEPPHPPPASEHQRCSWCDSEWQLGWLSGEWHGPTGLPDSPGRGMDAGSTALGPYTYIEPHIAHTRHTPDSSPHITRGAPPERPTERDLSPALPSTRVTDTEDAQCNPHRTALVAPRPRDDI